MFGLENLAHAARADLIEERVVAKDQRLGPALIDFLGLEFRQMLALHELASEFLGILRKSLRGNEVFQFSGAITPESAICLTNCSSATAMQTLSVGIGFHNNRPTRLAERLLQGDTAGRIPLLAAYVVPIREPAGTGSFCGALGAKCACPLLLGGFSDRHFNSPASYFFQNSSGEYL